MSSILVHRTPSGLRGSTECTTYLLNELPFNRSEKPHFRLRTPRADIIRGLGGADRIYGKAGADRLYGGKDRKKDFLYGGRGNDWIVIRRNDRVYAGRGNDVVVRPDYSGMYLLYVWCGPGYDKVLANPWLRAGGNDCEKWE